MSIFLSLVKPTTALAVSARPTGQDRVVPPPHSPTALISWSHSEPGWSERQRAERRAKVVRLAAALRGLGIDVELDLYHYNSGQDWTRWGPQAVRDRDYVLIIVSPAWRAAWEGRGDLTRGVGAAAEADVLRTLYNEDRAAFHRKVRLVVLPDDDPGQIPDGLAGPTRYPLRGFEPADLHDLVGDLTGQAAYPRPPLGPIPVLPPRLDPAAPALSRDTAERARLEAALASLPEPEPGEGPHLPWWRAREQVLNALAHLDRPIPQRPAGTPAAVPPRYGQLDHRPAVPWRDQASTAFGRDTAVAVHAVPVPAAPVPARRLAELADALPDAVRRSGAVPATAGLQVEDRPDGITVHIPPPDRPRAWDTLDPGRLAGVRVRSDGTVTAWRTLPTDRMGPAIAWGEMPHLIADCLRMCGAAAAVLGQPRTVALAVEIGPSTTLVSVITPGQFGNRTSAILGTGNDRPVRVGPDETVDATALGPNVPAAAQALTSMLRRAWEQR